jgi:hypothetical protein
MLTNPYYVGRLNMFEDQYKLAEENLEYAFVHCHARAVVNNKRILKTCTREAPFAKADGKV